jgi:hypothetical protein
MKRRKERLEKCNEPIGIRFESRGGAMQTRTPTIRLFKLVAKDLVALWR